MKYRLNFIVVVAFVLLYSTMVYPVFAATLNINTTVQPADITNLTAVDTFPGSGEAVITWNRSLTPNVSSQILEIDGPQGPGVTFTTEDLGLPVVAPGALDNYINYFPFTNLSGLVIGETYIIRIISVSGSLNSPGAPPEAQIIFVPAPANPPPNLLTAVASEDTSTLTWNNGGIDDPALECRLTGSLGDFFSDPLAAIAVDSGWVPCPSSAVTHNHTFTGLNYGDTYTYHVQTRDGGGGHSAYSNVLELTQPGAGGGGGSGGGSSRPECGDGNLDQFEECDDGNRTSGDGCSSGCMLEPQICGNGTVEAPEQCDDGNTINGDGCSSTCTVEGTAPSLCGNGILNPGEECDDGNTINGDGCSSSCSLEAACGNGSLDPGEECDDGNTTNGDGCSSTCLMEGPGPECGNGLLEITEECDDGNTTSGDGCTAACEVEHSAPLECGNGILDVGEECDDGNTADGDGCSAFCVIEEEPEAVCGNGILEEPEEECDDGNTINDDGCSATCEIEEIVDIIIEIRGAPEHRKTDLPLNENGFAEDRQIDGQQTGFFDGISADLFRITNTPNLGLNAQLDIFKPSINNLDVLGVGLDNWGYAEVPVTIVTGTYDFGLNGEAHNTRVVKTIEITEDTERIVLDFTRGETVKLVAGDTRDDNYVNALDIATMLASYKATGANLNDLNKDESPIVNAIDIAILIWNYKATGESF